MSRPELYVFAISHYCEKARWALDWQGVDYELRHLAPGPHIEVMKQLGVAGSSVPVVQADGEVVQGSSDIIDWADMRVADPSRRLTPDGALAEECRVLEARVDEIAGVHVRRYYYSEAMVDYPDTVRPIFTNDLEPSLRATIEENWAVVRQLMIGRMDLGPEQRLESLGIVEGELDWFDGLLGDGRRYLVGDRFSRADLTAASLLAPIALPKEHPTYGMLEVPPKASEDLARWTKRLVIEWVREMYRNHR